MNFNDLIYYLPIGLSSLILLVVIAFWNKIRNIKNDLTTDVTTKSLEWVDVGHNDSRLLNVDKPTLPVRAISKLNDRLTKAEAAIKFNLDYIEQNNKTNETLNNRDKELNDRIDVLDKSIEAIELNSDAIKNGTDYISVDAFADYKLEAQGEHAQTTITLSECQSSIKEQEGNIAKIIQWIKQQQQNKQHIVKQRKEVEF